MKYAFIEQNGCEVSTARQCRWLGVSTSGYYDWRARRERPRPRSERQAVVDEAVRIAFAAARERYGSPRLTVELNESGFTVAENTVAASLRRQGLVAKAGRKFKATTNSSHTLAVSPNLLSQDFTCDRINQKWCGDITYLWCDEGWMYLATVIDLYSRRVIGWSVSHRMTKQLACDAMVMAIEARTDIAGVIMHTDRGSQYCSNQFQALLRGHEIESSMSARGDCFDNAVRGELLSQREDRGDPWREVHDARIGTHGGVRVHRDVLQCDPPAQHVRQYKSGEVRVGQRCLELCA